MFGGINDSITAKLTRMNMLVSCFALLIASTTFVVYDLVAFRDGIVYNLSTQAQIIGSNSVTALLFDDPQSSKKTVSALASAPNIVQAIVYTAQGQPFAVYRRSPEVPLPVHPAISPSDAESHSFRGQNVALLRPIFVDGKLLGSVYIESDMKRLIARLERYGGIALLILIGSIFAALLVSQFSRRSISQPIIHLAKVAGTVSRDQNYSIRADLAPGHNEIATLITSFNEMLAQIQRRDAELQTAHDELELRVQERTNLLTAANSELEAFSYSVSHDLRAPLRSIDGFSQALLDDCGESLNEDGKKHLARVRAATQRMGTLIDDLLTLSRVTRNSFRAENLDLSSVARAIAAELQKTHPGRAVEIRIEEGLQASADAGLLRIALENLLGNAWKFTSKRPSATIQFGKTQQNGHSAFFVRDDGAGFDPAYSDRLFGPFQRLHAMTEFPGTGVGLAIVQRIVRRHGGKVWAESAVDQGATFFFTLNELNS